MKQPKIMLGACVVVLGLSVAPHAWAQTSSSSSSNSSSCGVNSSASSSSSSQPAPDVQCSVTGSSDWGGGFQTSVDVTNTGDDAVNGWEVALDLVESHTVTNSWGAELSHEGATLHAQNTAWNGNLQPGESVSFGFQGTYSGSFVEPECATGSSDDGVNDPPVVDFTVEATGRSVFVDAGASSDPDGDELEYVIDFDVFDVVYQATGWHTFFVPGDYRITVTANDGELSASKSRVITVGQAVSGNAPPVAKLFLTSTAGSVGIHTSLSFDPDGDPLDKTAVRVNRDNDAQVTLTVHDGTLGDTVQKGIMYGCNTYYDPVAYPRFTFRVDGNTVYVDGRETTSATDLSWDFGDGSATQSGVLASHTYAEPGQYDVTLYALGIPLRESKTVAISVGEGVNHEPRAGLNCWTRTLDGVDYWVECQARGTHDPDDDDLSLTWDMGDGTTYTTEAITEPVTHYYAESGAYNVDLTVSDGESSASATGRVEVVNVDNRQPAACFDIQEDETTSTPLDIVVDAACSSDADSDPLQYSWDFGDGSTAEGVTAGHTFASAGTYQVELTVSDGVAGDSALEIWTAEDTDTSAPAVCEYVLGNEWSGGFTGKVTIANESDESIDGWEVAWEYTGGDRITNAWNANLSGNNPYTVSNLSWNSRIAPGQTVEIGFQGTTSGGAAEIPEVTGAVCR